MPQPLPPWADVRAKRSFSAAITKSSFRRHFHVTSPQQDWLKSPISKGRVFRSMAESINGWRRDPFGGHEFRYFSNDGRPTRLVSDGGVRSYDWDLGPGDRTAQPTLVDQAQPVQVRPPTLSVEPGPTSVGPHGPTRQDARKRRRLVPARIAVSARTFYRSGWRKPVTGVVICGLLALGAEIATAATSNGPPSVTLQQGVYVGAADPSGVASFAAATKTYPTIASDFLPSNSGWDAMDGSGGFLAWIFPSLANASSDTTKGWTGSGYTVSLGVPMIPTWPDGGRGSGVPAGTLADGADGDYNNYFVALAENLINSGEGDAYLRLGWEFDGGWYDWSATNPVDEANFAEYFRQIVTAMRTVPGENFKFVWNPTAAAFVPGGESYNPNYNVALAYPGNSYVDYIGVDAYDQTWVTPQTPSTEWNQTTFPELTAAAQFAQAQGKPLAIPEWGVAVRADGHGLGDDPLYINNMITWMQNPANNVAYESYFDYDGSSQEDAITDDNFPNSLAAFINDFNGAASTTTTTAPKTTTTTTTTATAAPAGGSCTNPSFSSSSAEATDNTDANGGPQYWWVNNDAWSGGHGPQTLNVCNQSSWNVVSDQTNDGGAVETYPDTEYDVGGRSDSEFGTNSLETIGAFSTITSTFDEGFPTGSGEAWDAGYDLWVGPLSTANGASEGTPYDTEVMIWNQWQGSQDFWANCANGIGSCPSGGNAQAVTLDGVPYHFFDNSGELMFFRDTQVSSGSVDILAAFNWLVAHPSADPHSTDSANSHQDEPVVSTNVPTELEYGVEIVGTPGTQTFPLTGLTFNAS
jgi:hypothetical protein